MRVAKIYLIFMAVMSIVFGVIYLFNPSAMMAPMGFGTLAPSALTDARATYGGLQIGMGVFLLLCLNPERVRLGLLFTLVSVTAVAASRAVGFAIDGDIIDVLLYTFIFEAVLTLVTLVIFLRTPSTATA
jgi:hypothetical protein